VAVGVGVCGRTVLLLLRERGTTNHKPETMTGMTGGAYLFIVYRIYRAAAIVIYSNNGNACHACHGLAYHLSS